MTGEDLKAYIKKSGLTMTDIAKQMGTTPQNIQARLSRKTLKADFIQRVKSIVDACSPLRQVSKLLLQAQISTARIVPTLGRPSRLTEKH